MTPVTEVDEEETTTTTTTTTTSTRRLLRRSSVVPPTPRAVEAEARHKQRGRPKRKRETASYLIRACDEIHPAQGSGAHEEIRDQHQEGSGPQGEGRG